MVILGYIRVLLGIYRATYVLGACNFLPSMMDLPLLSPQIWSSSGDKYQRPTLTNLNPKPKL